MATAIDFEPETVQAVPGQTSPIDFQPIDFEPEPQSSGAVSTGFHRVMNDVRSFGAAAGKYIFHGLQGLRDTQTELLANPPAEAYQATAEESLLPAGEQRQIEQERIAALTSRVPEVKSSADYWRRRAAEVDQESGVDPQLAQTWDARISRVGGSATVMSLEGMIPAVGVGILALNGAASAEAEARNAGKTPQEAETAAVRSLIGLGIFGGANKAAALGVAKLVPAGASRLTRFVAQFLGQDAANEATSRAIGAWEAASDAGPGDKVAAATKALTDTNLETSTLNAIYAGIGSAHEAGRVRPLDHRSEVNFEADPVTEPSRPTKTSILFEPEAEARPLPSDVPRQEPIAPAPTRSPETQPTTQPQILFRADEELPFMTKVRMEDELVRNGYTEEQLASMTSAQASEAMARIRPVQPVTVTPPEGVAGAEPIPPIPRRVVPATEDELGRREYEAELLQQGNEAQAAQGREVIDAVIRAGGLPSKRSEARGPFAGEIGQLEEMVRDPLRQQADINAMGLFRKNAPGLDRLATSLRDQGFDVKTPDDVLQLLDRRIRSGQLLYGTQSAAAAEHQPLVHAMGAASPHRAPATPPPLPPLPAPPVAGAVTPMRSWWQQRSLGLRKLVAPQTIDAPARKVANIVRDYNGRLANTIIQADHALAKARADFDRTPVPRNWKYDPKRPLPRNYAFIDNSERGGANLSPQDRQLKTQTDQMFNEAVDEVHRVKPAALRSLIQDYFPHIWEDPEQAKRVFAQIVSKRPLEGPKSFLKQRVLEYTLDGLKAGLRPVSDNPIDMVLTKLHEVHRFVAAQDMLTEAKAIGARKFVYIFEKPPDGWTRIDDPTSTVHGPPFVTVPEAFDAQMRAKTIELLSKLGVPHERLASLGGQRWGEAEKSGTPPGRIRTKFAGPLSVYWHEMGHILDYRYNWLEQIAPLRPKQPGHAGVVVERQQPNFGGKSEIENQFRKLADLRIPQTGATPGFAKYVRTKAEKAAVMLEAYIHAPDRMKDVAPNIYSRVQKFIRNHPELQAIEDIRPNLAIGSSKQNIPVGGMVTLGSYYMPEGAAQVFTNYLSPGLQRFGIIRSIRQSTNILSGLQLGFSAFHAGFTSIDAAVSQFALGLRYLSEGKLGMAAFKIATTPAAPITNYITGQRVQRAMLDPNYGSPEIRNVADLAVKAGLRATVDPFWRTQITRNMLRAWHEGGVKGYSETLLKAPFAASEQLMRPILEYLVPRQKLGVFAGMAQAHMERLGPNADVYQVREAMARAADSTEDRMGQMTYDNLFYNRVIRDAALLGFRAYGWTFGKYRALFGGLSDLVQTPGRIRSGDTVVTDRMAYLLALPMVAAGIGSVMNYMMTGQSPQDWRDALMPRTGQLDRHGNPQRLSLPTYIKDILSDWHDFPNTKKMLVSFSHKLNPWLDVAGDLINNADFYGTKVYNEDDPFFKQQLDKAQFVMQSATPFSVTSAARLQESDPSISQMILPFFGFVPAKAELTMTPAQIRAAELMYATLPRGARSKDKAEQSKLVSTLMRDLREQSPAAGTNLAGALATGQVHPNQLGNIFRSLQLSPFEYQVKKLSAEDAMRVWDLANPTERNQIRNVLFRKISASKSLPPEERVRYFRLLTDQVPAPQ